MSLAALPAAKRAALLVVLIQNMEMRSRRRASERRRRRRLWIYTVIQIMLQAGIAEDLHRLEDLLKAERIAMQVALRRLASKVGTLKLAQNSSNFQIMLQAGIAEDLHRLEDLLKADNFTSSSDIWWTRSSCRTTSSGLSFGWTARRSTSCTTRFSFRL
jgi:hypothetical protein